MKKKSLRKDERKERKNNGSKGETKVTRKEKSNLEEVAFGPLNQKLRYKGRMADGCQKYIDF